MNKIGDIKNYTLIDKNYKYLIYLIFCITAFFRFYNINYENLWIDEIISFWVANPNISFKETLIRHNSLEQVPILFNAILKIYFNIFSYNYSISRYLVAILSLLSFFVSFLIIKEVSKKKSVILFFTYLLAINIYLIKFSLELRVYSLVVLLTSLSILLFIKALKKDSKIYYFLYVFFSILSIYSHPFCLIVFFSICFYYFINYLNKTINNKNLNICICIIFIFSIFYYGIYFLNLNEITSWIPIIDLKFFTNFFFSKFFGSRILGLIYLITLIYLLIYFKNTIYRSVLLLFFIIVFNSYFFPILFSFLIKPILIDRYIIFTIISILVLISVLIFMIKSEKIKNTLIILILILTTANFLTEDAFKQIYKETPKYKPDFTNALKYIDKSNSNILIIKNFETKNKDKIEFYKILTLSVYDYIDHMIKLENYDINLINIRDYKNKKSISLWVMCYYDLDIKNCKINDKIKNIKIKKDLNFSKINLKKITIN